MKTLKFNEATRSTDGLGMAPTDAPLEARPQYMLVDRIRKIVPIAGQPSSMFGNARSTIVCDGGLVEHATETAEELVARLEGVELGADACPVGPTGLEEPETLAARLCPGPNFGTLHRTCAALGARARGWAMAEALDRQLAEMKARLREDDPHRASAELASAVARLVQQLNEA